MIDLDVVKNHVLEVEEFTIHRAGICSGLIPSLQLRRNAMRSGTCLFSSLHYGQKDRQREDGNEHPYRHRVHQIVVQIPPRGAQDKELDIRSWHFDVAEPVADIPMPLRAEAIAEAIEDTQAEPGKGRQHNRSEMNLSGFFPDPPEQHEQDEGGMEYKEEDVQETVHQHDFILHVWWSLTQVTPANRKVNET